MRKLRIMTPAKIWIGLGIAACILYSCSKNKYGSSPDLSLKTVSTNVVPFDTNTSLITFTFNLTEKQYNPGDSLHIHIVPTNCNQDTATYVFPMTSLGSGIPETNTGGGFKGELQAAFSNGTFFEINGGYPNIQGNDPCDAGPAGPNGQPLQNDTCYFYFCLGSGTHFSDTIKAGPIVMMNS